MLAYFLYYVLDIFAAWFDLALPDCLPHAMVLAFLRYFDVAKVTLRLHKHVFIRYFPFVVLQIFVRFSVQGNSRSRYKCLLLNWFDTFFLWHKFRSFWNWIPQLMLLEEGFQSFVRQVYRLSSLYDLFNVQHFGLNWFLRIPRVLPSVIVVRSNCIVPVKPEVFKELDDLLHCQIEESVL